jgi:hypothetical protein
MVAFQRATVELDWSVWMWPTFGYDVVVHRRARRRGIWFSCPVFLSAKFALS